jgi:hypothetical protein
MARGALTLRGQRRRAAQLAADALAQSQAAGLHRRRLGAAIETRIATKESLLLGVVAGMTFGMLAPRRARRAHKPRSKPAPARHPILRQALRMARTYAISYLLRVVSGAGTPESGAGTP